MKNIIRLTHILIILSFMVACSLPVLTAATPPANATAVPGGAATAAPTKATLATPIGNPKTATGKPNIIFILSLITGHNFSPRG